MPALVAACWEDTVDIMAKNTVLTFLNWTPHEQENMSMATVGFYSEWGVGLLFVKSQNLMLELTILRTTLATPSL